MTGLALPTGTVTFLFTDIEGSTRLLDELGEDGYAEALAEHRRSCARPSPRTAASRSTRRATPSSIAFADADGGARGRRRRRSGARPPGPIRVRMGIHTGEPLSPTRATSGSDVHRAARIAAAGHGGQVVLSAATHALVDRRSSPTSASTG